MSHDPQCLAIDSARQYRNPRRAVTEADDILWPPRASDSRGLASRIDRRTAICLNTTAQHRNAFYAIRFEPPCTLRADVEVDRTKCSLDTDLCRQHELIERLRSSRGAMLWNGSRLPAYWEDARKFGPHYMERLPDLFNEAAMSDEAIRARQSVQNVPSPHYSSCALVGGAPHLSGLKLGRVIDEQHEAVFRFNNHPLAKTSRVSYGDDYGQRATVHVVQSQRNGSASHLRRFGLELILQLVIDRQPTMVSALHAMAGRSRPDAPADRNMGSISASQPASKSKPHQAPILRILSPEALLAFHQLNPHQTFTGTLGVWASLALCEKPPRVFGFSTMETDLSSGFTHYFKHQNKSGERISARFAKDVVWMHALDCLGYIRLHRP